MIVKEIKFKSNYRKFKAEQSIQFKDKVTVIVGENGSGKSSLIGCIRYLFDGSRRWNGKGDDKPEEILYAKPVNNVVFQHTDLNKDLLSNLAYFCDDIPFQIKCSSASSGEGLILQLKRALEKQYDLLILDEPERGLSLNKLRLMKLMIENYIEENPNTQVIITTHAPKLMSIKKEVLVLPEGRMMNVEDVEDYFDSLPLDFTEDVGYNIQRVNRNS